MGSEEVPCPECPECPACDDCPMTDTSAKLQALWDRDAWDNRWQRRCDMILALIPIIFLLSQVIVNALTHLFRIFAILFLGQRLNAFDLTRMANDFCTFVLNFLVICLWSTLCFQTKNMQHFWSWKSWIFGNTTMSGIGFVPKPAALSVGLLLFLSGVFVSQRVVKGGDLLKEDKHIASGEWCRADVKELSTFSDQWFSRFQRRVPVGCYFGQQHPDVVPDFCNSTLAAGYETAKVPVLFNYTMNETCHPLNLAHPYDKSNEGALLSTVSGMLPPSVHIPFLGKVLIRHRFFSDSLSDQTDPGYICTYQCVKWKVWGFQDVVSKLGVVLAGAGVVTKMTESFTSFFGIQRVDVDTSAAVLRTILDRTGKPLKQLKFLHRSCALCAWLLFLIRVGTMLVYKIDDHGFYTVDYYVSQTLFFSVLTSQLIRVFHPYHCMRMAYTNNMWKKGSESFIMYDDSEEEEVKAQEEDHKKVQEKEEDHKKVQEKQHKSLKPRSVDVFMWLHLGIEERNYLLIMHARKIDAKAHDDPVECIMPFQYEQFLPANTTQPEAERAVFFRMLKGKQGAIGKVSMIEGNIATVVWNQKDIEGFGEHDQHEEGSFWDTKKKTTKIHINNLVDFDDAWTKLIREFVGNEEKVKKVHNNIIKQLKKNDAVAKEKSLLVKFRTDPRTIIDVLLALVPTACGRARCARALGRPGAGPSVQAREVVGQDDQAQGRDRRMEEAKTPLLA